MLMILQNSIRMIDGLYSLNDLHRASGSKAKHRPANFMRRKDTQALIDELKNECYSNMSNTLSPAYKIIQGNYANGEQQGTFVCRELVYAYAMWISPKFHLAVIRAFDSLATQHQQLHRQLNELQTLLNQTNFDLSHAGRFLSIVGKQVKPKIVKEINHTIGNLQLTLNFNSFNHAKNNAQGAKNA